MQAGLNVAVPALFILGLGTLLYGLAPRLAAPVLYALVLWSFLVEIIGTSITSNHWLIDTALLSHLGAVPATGVDWAAAGWLTGLAVICALAGLAAAATSPPRRPCGIEAIHRRRSSTLRLMNAPNPS